MKAERSIIVAILVLLFYTCKREPKEITQGEFYNTKESLVEVNKVLVKKDEEKIKSFIKRHNWNMRETGTGLWYMIYQQGKGEKAQEGLVATINFNISLLDGTECYSSDASGPKRFKIGQGGVESGLEEGILLMHSGDQARFIMPPHLAYGLIGDDKKIPARAILVYEVELTDLSEN